AGGGRASGSGGGGGAAGPRAARPGAAGEAGGAGGPAGAATGRDNAATRGARSASVDHRNSSIVNGASPAASITTARSFMAGASARTGRTAGQIASAMAPARQTNGRLLRITSLTLRAPEPFDEPLEFLVVELGAALAHLHRHDAPSIRGKACVVHALDVVAGGARSPQERIGLVVGEERRDLPCHVCAGKWLGLRSEPHRQPVEQNRAVLFGKRHV